MNNYRPGIVDIQFANEELIIRPRGIWKLWSLRATRRLPYLAVTSARLSKDPTVELRPRLRSPGLGTLTSLAGYTSGPSGRAWWCYRHGSTAVLLTTNLPRLAHVVVVTDDDAATARAIQKKLTTAHSSPAV